MSAFLLPLRYLTLKVEEVAFDGSVSFLLLLPMP